MTPQEIRAAADRVAAAGDSKPRLARDPVNLPAIRNWLEAIGGTAPADSGPRGDDPGLDDAGPARDARGR
jgi:hypothetical protein